MHIDHLLVLPDPPAVAEAAARRLADTAATACAARGAFHVALAGGSTPRLLYERLAEPPWRERMDWTCWQCWFGDERCVPPDHPDSNYRMAAEALLDRLPLPRAQRHPMPCTLPPEAAAERYAAELATRLPHEADDWPVFDLILLGQGPDGHTASLFPGTGAVARDDATVLAVYVAPLDSWRLSLARPVIEAARQVVFLVTGAGKAAVVGEALGSPRGDLPVQRLAPRGEVTWLLDRAAAARLPPERRPMEEP